MVTIPDPEKEITKEDAIESLGSKAERYVVESWEVKGAEEEEEEEEEEA